MRVTLPPGPGEIACPEWSPDGRQVAFPVGYDLWVADAASGKTTVFPMAAAPSGQQGLAWSHDGSRIAVPEPGADPRRPCRRRRLDADPGGTVEGTPSSVGWTAGDDGIVDISADPTTDTGAMNVVEADGKSETALMPTPAMASAAPRSRPTVPELRTFLRAPVTVASAS